MGNSMGGLGDYWDEIRARKNLIGGFIWDMIDQGLLTTNAQGEEYYAFGGDFGDQPNDENFCINGVFAPDRTPNPHAWEAKYIFQPIEMTLIGSAPCQVQISSRLSHTTTAQYETRWEVYENGKMIQSGTLPTLSIAAGDSEIVTLPLKAIAYNDNAEYWVRVSMHESEDRLWCDKGYEVAYEKMLLRARATEAQPYLSSSKATLSCDESTESVVLSTKDLGVTISKESGYLTSYTAGGVELLSAPLMPNLTRPNVDNDVRGATSGYMKRVREFWSRFASSLEVESVDVAVAEDNKSIVVGVTYAPQSETSLSLSYTIYSDGMVNASIELDAAESTPDIMRFGMQMGIPLSYDNTTFYGRGPFENYMDRKRGAKVGEYSFATEDLFYSYVQPQENGNRCDVQWAKFTQSSNKKQSLSLVGDSEFNFSIWAYTASDLQESKHPYELTEAGFYTLNIDQEQAALAGTLSEILPKYELKAGKRSFSFSFGVTK